jgi:hypothetical protein
VYTCFLLQELQRKLGRQQTAGTADNGPEGATALSDAMTSNSFQDIPFELRALEVVLDTVRQIRVCGTCENVLGMRLKNNQQPQMTGVDDV